MTFVRVAVRNASITALLAMILTTALADAFAVRELARMKHGLEHIVAGHAAEGQLGRAMSAAVQTVQRALPVLVLRDDAHGIAVDADGINTALQAHDTAWAQLQRHPGASLGVDLNGSSEQARRLIAQVVELARAGHKDEAAALLFTQAAPAVLAWQERIDGLIAEGVAHQASEYEAAAAEFSYTRWLLYAIGLLNLTIGAAFGWMMWRRSRHDAAIRRALLRSKAVADEAVAAKSAFLANMSHEIRTPMNGVLGIAELLHRTSLDNTQRKYVRTILRAGNSLLALLNDILDLSKVESGRLELEERAMDLRRVLQACVDLAAPNASRRGLNLTLDIADDLVTWVIGDPLRLQQVINNLLGNAVKFTPAGEIRVSVQAHPELGKDGYQIRVRDTGPGIDAKAAARLFQPFTQGDESTARKFGGSGLGLAIAQRIVEAMGGRLSLESKPGAGSTFSFAVRLPAAQASESSFGAQSGFAGMHDSNAASVSKPLRVLLVEDNEVNQLYGQALLQQMGHQVDIANDGLEAQRLAMDGRHDLILMDCHMPNLDGFEATRRIRRDELRTGLPRRPVVALTATAMAEDRQRCFNAGMDEVLTKPFSRKELEIVLERFEAEVARGHRR